MNIEKFLLDNGIRITKRLDQYFLLNGEILEAEVRLAGLEKDDVVLEIGPGIGNLTKLLAEKCNVIAVEKDGQFIPLLKNIKNVHIIHNDILIVIKNVSFNKIVSNIPYSISQPLLLELLRHDWKKAVLIVQKEFAEKLVNGRLGILIRDCGDVVVEALVSGDNFYPPAADSAIVVINKTKPMDEGLWKFLTAVYRGKNKNVRNAVKNYPSEMGKKKIHQLTDTEIRQLCEMNKD